MSLTKAGRHGLGCATAALLALAMAHAALRTRPAHSATLRPSPYVTARRQDFAQQWTAYGQVRPIASVKIRAMDAGIVSRLQVLPGSAVAAGQSLARLTGARMQSLLTRREAAVASARARLDAALKGRQIARRQLADRLGTRDMADAADAELAGARAALQTALARRDEARELRILKSPVAGTVLTVNAADGEQATPGQTVLTILPSDNLWVRAEYYGADAARIHPGMSGDFKPEGGAPAVPVTVVTAGPSLDADGGVRVGLLPRAPEALPSGLWGEVTLAGPAQPMVAVPTGALILDRGAWWVLVHTPSGDLPRRVVPGPARGWQTAIASGLEPGEKVVAQNAFLRYHRNIANAYQPPD